MYLICLTYEIVEELAASRVAATYNTIYDRDCVPNLTFRP